MLLETPKDTLEVYQSTLSFHSHLISLIIYHGFLSQ